jgi:hypothetical protein
MLVCEAIYGCKRGSEIAAFLMQAMGQPCPCKRDLPCPLLPKDEEVVDLPTPRRMRPPDVELIV